MRKNYHQYILALCGLIFLFGCSSEPEESVIIPEEKVTLKYVGGSPVLITEVDSRNSFYKDTEGDDPGWVELYNPADTAVNLSGYSFVDNHEIGNIWTFGNVVVAPKSYVVVFFSEKNRPNAQNPSDTINMIGSGCWGWSDIDNSPIAGTSTVEPVFTNYCYNTETGRRFSAQMQHGEDGELGWHSTCVFIGALTSDPEDVVDLSKTNELLLTGYLPKNMELEVRLAQTDIDDYKGWFSTIKGTGDSNSTYRILLPQNTNFPDLKNIYGTRFSPTYNEMKMLSFEFTSYIAYNSGSEAHTSFKLKKNGGSLYLINQEGILDSVAYPELPPEKTWSRGETGWGYADASPKSVVLSTIWTEKLGKLELPPSGFFSAPFNVEFTAPEGQEIRCEQGGFVPKETSPLFAGSLMIDHSMVLRCALFKAGALTGEVVSRTYLFETQPTVATVFITGDPLAFFDPDTGIYELGPNASFEMPNYGANFWKDRELPIHVDLIEANAQTPAFSMNAGYQIFGNYSRSNPKKSVAIVFREQYGDNKLEYPLFPEHPNLKEFKVFLLRNNGSSFGLDYIRDMLSSSISRGLGVDYQKGRASVVFYNGEYFGIHNIRERSNEYYFETNYGFDPNAIDLLKANNEASSGSSVGYTEMMDWIQANGVVSNENYQFVSTLMDVNNYLNYVHTEIFNNNRDWPGNNLKKWRNTNPITPWKWFLYDQDFGWDYPYVEEQHNYNIFEFITEENGPDWPNGPEHTLLLRKLLENNSFKAAFINRYTTLLSMNFEPSRLDERIQTLMSAIEAEIPRDQDRWLNSWQINNMESELEKIKAFAHTRQEASLLEMQTFFSLPAVKKVTLLSEGSGRIAVHQLGLDRSSMTISFFEGFPVFLSAEPNAGGIFKEWSDGELSPIREINPSEVDTLKAIFR